MFAGNSSQEGTSLCYFCNVQTSQLAERLLTFVDGPYQHRFSFLSYHDTSIQAVLKALGNDPVELYPGFLGALHLQVYKRDSDGELPPTRPSWTMKSLTTRAVRSDIAKLQRISVLTGYDEAAPYVSSSQVNSSSESCIIRVQPKSWSIVRRGRSNSPHAPFPNVGSKISRINYLTSTRTSIGASATQSIRPHSCRTSSSHTRFVMTMCIRLKFRCMIIHLIPF